MGRQHTVQDKPDLTIPEDFIVRAKLNEIKYETVSGTSQRTKEDYSFEKSTWWFEVTSDNQYNGRKVKGEVTSDDGNFLSNHPNNKFRLWASALLGRSLEAGDNLDDDDLVGLSCDITVVHQPDRKDPAKKWERLDQVIPLDGAFDFNDEPPF